MDEFDPFETEFDPTVDPLTADQRGLAILSKLEEGENMRGDFDPEFDAAIDAGIPKLKANLARYQEYKATRGEKLFSYEPEVAAREEAMGDEKLARSAIHLLQADQETFDAFLEENGDANEYKLGQAFMQDKTILREEYSTKQLLKQSGYSEREIESGAAEPHMRKRLNAKEDGTETTRAAYLRWGLSKVNEIDRRREITTSASKEAMNQFLGMSGDVDSFEEALANANPDISNEERTLVRRIYNQDQQNFQKEFSDIKPLVQKTFNTIAGEEGIKTLFGEDGESFESMDEAVRAMGEIPKEDFGKLLLMLSKTAEEHGQDVDGFFNKLGKNFTRAAGGLARESSTPVSRALTQNLISRAELAAKGDTGNSVYKLTNPEGVTSYAVLMKHEENFFPHDVKAEIVKGEKGFTEVIAGLKSRARSLEYASEIYNWRETVANVGSDNMFVNDWVYGTVRSLPEMGAAATGVPGIILVASAQQERNMAEIRRRDPNGDWGKYEEAAAVAGLGYSLLNRAQFKTLSAKLPATNKLVLELGKRIGIEALQETTQELTLATTLELYGALDEDIKDFDLGQEVVDAVKRFPRTMFAVAPLAVAGVAGRKALEKMDQKAFERILRDSELLEAYGVDPDNVLKIQNLSTPDALDFIQENNGAFISNMDGKFEASLSGDSGAVLDSKESPKRIYPPKVDAVQLEAQLRQPQRRLLPDEQEQKNYNEWKAENGVETSEGTTPMGAVLEDTYTAYLEEQLKESLMGDSNIDNNLGAARLESQLVFREEIAKQQKEQFAQSKAEEQKALEEEAQRAEATQRFSFESQIIAQADGTFSVTNGDKTVLARSPEEAAEAVFQLEPATMTVGAGQQAEQGVDPSTAQDETIDPNFQADMVFHSFIAPGFGGPNAAFEAGENKSRKKDALPPRPDAKTGEITWAAKKRFGFQSWLGQRDVPSKTLQRTLDEGTRKAKGVEAQFNDIALALNDRVKRHVRKQPSATRDAAFKKVQADSYLALKGDEKAMARLPRNVKKVVKQGRESIDAYSQELIDTGAVSKDLAESVGSNIGAYITREFKVYDPKAKWNYQTVTQQKPEIYEAALKDIMAVKGIDRKEADVVIRGMLDPSKARNFLSGNSTLSKINVSKLIKRKDLSKPILDLLGEVRNPAVNIKNTGTAVSEMAITNATQAHMAEQLLAAGLGSRTPNPDLGHTVRLGEETFEFVTKDDEGNPTVGRGTRTSKAFTGFGEIYLDPELAAGLAPHFTPGLQKGRSGFQITWDQLAKVSGVGKFAQVILNPAAYPTNFLGGVAVEIFNGRLSLNAKGARSYVKFGSFRNFGKLPNEVYGVKEQMAFYEQTGADFAKAGGALSLGRNQLNTEMQQQGIRDNSVLAEDLNQTMELGYGEAVGKVSRGLSKAYQASDNASKRSAFAHELDKWIAAEPNSTMDVLVQKAAEDVRLTTQNYDMVPALLKQFSQRSFFVGTYISFSYELFRNTKNTVVLAQREIRSGNPVLRKAGMKRVAGMATTGALLYAINQGVSAWMTGMDDDEREEFRAGLPPWLENSEVVMTGADENSISYFDASYLIPHQIFYNAAFQATRGDSVGDSSKKAAKALFAGTGGMNIMQQTLAEAITNKKRGGGAIYNPEITPEGTPGHVRAITGHFAESAFTPGILRSYRKFQKAKTEEVGYAGTTATMDDMMMGLVGVRPYRQDTSSPKYLDGNLVEFASRSRTAKSHISEYKQSKRTEAEQKAATAQVEAVQAKLLEKFKAKVKMFKRANISDERIKKAVKDASVPKYMRSELKLLLQD